MSEAGRREFFAERTGQTLEVRAGTDGGGGAVPLRIDRVDDYGSGDGSRFSVLMSGPGDRFLAQATYEVTLPGAEPFELFVVPIGREGERYRYEAAFNRTGP